MQCRLPAYSHFTLSGEQRCTSSNTVFLFGGELVRVELFPADWLVYAPRDLVLNLHVLSPTVCSYASCDFYNKQ